MSIIVAVGSKNPVKCDSVKIGLQRLLNKAGAKPVIEVVGFDVPSGVSNQPMGDAETQEGAKQRALNVYAEYQKVHGELPDFAVGLEGGVRKDLSESFLECFAWMVVYDGSFCSKASTASILLPGAVARLILEEGLELGHADDLLFGRSNSKQQDGSVGLISRGCIDRTEYYAHAISLAFSPFLWPSLYPVKRPLLPESQSISTDSENR
jgi:inosine/xanthosine triphosphatase